ncbi:hypothetical protein B566_EDAN018968 [Ephemera danica]|nr:hypothetical protein B566_EDAN018968 [Ephemera danica]
MANIMQNISLQGTPVLVIGAGIMGAGIAQVAAQSGHPVWLFDVREGAAAQAKDKMATALHALVAKGRFQAEDVAALLGRISPAAQLNEAAGAGLVVEAIVENLAAKRGLFQQLEGIVSPQCVLASNTSSISVTAIANGLKHPGRLVGMHFFNPVPLMKLVEVVAGLATAPEVAEAIFNLSRHWNKVPVHAKSTPGFIVNRIARPYYAETLALLLEQAATPQVLDTCLKAAGFRLGPCELMDLVGHDTNFAVTNSVFSANFFDKRYQPSLLQQEMVEGGLYGRKSGRGFYSYPEGLPSLPVAVFEAPHTAELRTVRLLTTPLCTLEPQCAHHAAEMFGVLCDPAIYEFEGQPPPSPQHLAAAYARKESRLSPDGTEQWLNWVVRRPAGLLAGYVQATVLATAEAYIGYEFASAHWRQGLATAAVGAVLLELPAHYGVRTVVAVLKAANHRSLGLVRKLGFVPCPAAQAQAYGPEADELVWIKPV